MRLRLLILVAASVCEAYHLSVSAMPRQALARMRHPRMATRALNDMVLIELQTEPAKSAGGIMLPTNFDNEETEGAFQRQPPKSGTVVSVGPGLITAAGTKVAIPGISEGQRVVIKGGTDGVKLDPSDYDSALYLFPAGTITAVA